MLENLWRDAIEPTGALPQCVARACQRDPLD